MPLFLMSCFQEGDISHQIDDAGSGSEVSENSVDSEEAEQETTSTKIQSDLARSNAIDHSYCKNVKVSTIVCD